MLEVFQTRFQTRFDKWVEQAAAAFQVSEDYPLINDPLVDEAEIYEATFPFLEHFEDKEALPDFLMDRLVSSGCAPPVRFVVLNLLYLLTAHPDLDTQWSLSVTRKWCWEHLVSAVQILDRSMSLLQGPKELRWEIVNFCVIGDWDRAAGLYSRLKDLGSISPGEYHALLAEMYLSSVLAPWVKTKHNIDPTELPAFWEPALGSLWGFNARETSDETRATLAVLWAFDLSNTESYSDAERERISEAAHRWERALEMTPSAGNPLRVVSAKFHFLVGRYLEAAHSYEQFVKPVQQHPRTTNHDLFLKALRNAAECYRKADKSKSAVDLLEAFAPQFQTRKVSGSHWPAYTCPRP